MSQAVQSIALEWKEFNIKLESIDVWMKANIGDHYCGNSADSKLTLWFTAEVSDEEKAAVEAYWDALDADSAEATSYQSLEQIQASVATKAASGKAKLIALGLTEDEASALLGK